MNFSKAIDPCDPLLPELLNLSPAKWPEFPVIREPPPETKRQVIELWNCPAFPTVQELQRKAHALVQLAQGLQGKDILLRGTAFLLPLATLEMELAGLSVWYPLSKRMPDTKQMALQSLLPAPPLTTHD